MIHLPHGLVAAKAVWLVALCLVGATLACATLRSPNDPIPTARPTVTHTVTATATATPSPTATQAPPPVESPFGG